jgi:hypothetical protein
MSVLLEAIKFNHDSGSATKDAINIRRNATEFVTVPEWRRGFCTRPEDSPAAYSMLDTWSRTITIQAKFRRTSPGIHRVWIRAVDPTVSPPGPSGCLPIVVQIIKAFIRLVAGNVLGEVKAREVTFLASGDTAFETFDLEGTKIWEAGVGARTTTWRWQYRHGKGGPWTDFATSEHRIYTILELPKAPWQQAPYSAANTQLPWADVLDYSCRWALLAKDRDTAGSGVTRNVYDLGPSVITYDCPGGGGTRYAWGAFNCTAFLERMQGGYGNGYYVNCSDCATIVSTFANSLGCDLWQSRMQWSFDLNPLLAIGSNVWQTACGWSGFSYHEVAWRGACTSDEEIFDACLQVDGDIDPTTAPHLPLLPTHMRFGDPGDGDYRDRLATPATRANCAPAPGTRQRRQVI